VISGNLFTRDYLLDGIDRTAQWIGLTDKSVVGLRKQLKSIAGKFLKVAKPNEADREGLHLSSDRGARLVRLPSSANPLAKGTQTGPGRAAL
jgi:hypothetical protein